MRLRHVCLCLFLLSGVACPALTVERGLQFTAEKLAFSLKPGLWQVKGDYEFTNATADSVRQTIYFPIPADSLCRPAGHVRISLAQPLPGQSVRLINTASKGFWFELTLPPGTLAVCQIGYSQQFSGRHVTYLLRTAGSWGKPLERAIYTLSVSKKLRLERYPLPNPHIRRGLFRKTYLWEYQNYAPKTDFQVEMR